MTRNDGARSHSGRSQHRTGLTDTARYFRPAALPGVEVLHARSSPTATRRTCTRHGTVPVVDHGAAAFDLDGRRHTAPAGTVFVVPPHAVHTGEVPGPDGFRYRVLYLDTESRPSLPGRLAARPRHALPVVIRHQALAADLSRLHGSLSLRGRAPEHGEILHAGVLVAIHAERWALRASPMNGRRRNGSTARAQRPSP
jgi:AraC-like ligand binding domain